MIVNVNNFSQCCGSASCSCRSGSLDPHRLIQIRIRILGSASVDTDLDPDQRIRIEKKRIRIWIQLLVNDFEFYFPCYVFPSLYFRLKNFKNQKILLPPLFSLLFMLPGSVPDPFSLLRWGSGSTTLTVFCLCIFLAHHLPRKLALQFCN